MFTSMPSILLSPILQEMIWAPAVRQLAGQTVRPRHHIAEVRRVWIIYYYN